MSIEQTFLIVKPDALKYSLTGYVLTIMSRTELIYAGAKVVRVSDLLAREHYSLLSHQPFFEDLVAYIKGELHYRGTPRAEFPFTADYRRVLVIAYHGKNAVSEVRRVVGPTNPIDARQESPGTIRAMGAVYNVDDGPTPTIFENLVHASATPEEAQSEIALWFEPREIPKPMRIFPVTESESYFFVTPDLAVSADPDGRGKCIVSPGDPVWESDYTALTSGLTEAPDEGGIRRAAAKYFL